VSVWECDSLECKHSWTVSRTIIMLHSTEAW
jgi:hypothetical protein